MAEQDNAMVGLLLDFENLIIPFEKRSGYQPGSVQLAPIVDFLEENFGPVIIRRAYADWSHRGFKGYERQLQDLGVEMIHVIKRTRDSMKNGADILLTADAVECLLLRPFVTDFAIVSGDSDIGPLVQKLKSHGKTVVVIGPDEKSTARHVIDMADRFKYYTDIVEPTPEPPKRRDRKRPLTPQQAIISILEESEGGLESAALKRQLCAKKEFEHFNQKALGFKTWTSFLRSIDRVAIRRRSDLGVEVSLKD
ncbi:MAG: NYN domain-containing protein [Planctomycetota bacterium]